ncbi:imidazole glycerol phosphate synthase subunit hisH [Sulfurimonas denitrificans DSM 1251]|jgi:glutamine amidotransferase|uniref:Imidazole glycerol phosphate synthase subunit HisH n=1 Tax=Sulfurimonas denitrificans (strain ATCC 33889 / DSM 1251) TaxID=326298 RepID=HIS5_SULDN|nr:imidazole glycerol phosphate synthase subunit HisH [Sulfurimonas denitrificans]Q30PY0.1 RecName: Full=Imidazole glycerol phosphate synthase subunit HisH; AltName: Full=IGP synthase glutaminase subunit; AltName: Full=IGP synthase subunit HisH; AltName: Full=ImGP synthase subunit HisH; Short=IGPS subunit HisH [Sulfurimonas denitrificans DSM 1251]ABB44951.1 imidazole glycerol phosphate synthase subunit hisH [Sulfurimonas denitrificans DSM 1251]MDD3442647.1 imidazole glycerol phosphate synthase s
MIAIVDYNMGNLASVQNAFAKIGTQTVIEGDPKKFKEYDKLILPGVGAFGDAMEHLRERGMIEAIKEFAASTKPILGICLGMQLLFESSEEFGEHEGLGLIKGKVVAFDTSKFEETLKVPHMGWNRMFTKEHPLFEGLDEEHYLYFVHSYHALCDDEKDSIGRTFYGYEFTSAVAHDNIMGIQPHPEKSHDNGLKILENFTKYRNLK